MCGVMEHDGTYDFGEAFARLTCLFEDAAGLAGEGQRAGLAHAEYEKLLGEIDQMMAHASTVGAELRLALMS